MDTKDFDTLNRLLDEVMKLAPCKGRGCVGHMNCEFGEWVLWGELCNRRCAESSMDGEGSVSS